MIIRFDKVFSFSANRSLELEKLDFFHNNVHKVYFFYIYIYKFSSLCSMVHWYSKIKIKMEFKLGWVVIGALLVPAVVLRVTSYNI